MSTKIMDKYFVAVRIYVVTSFSYFACEQHFNSLLECQIKKIVFESVLLLLKMVGVIFTKKKPPKNHITDF